MAYTVTFPNTKDEFRSAWRSNRAWLIPTLLMIGSWVYFLWPRKSVADTAKYQKLEAEKKELKQSVKLSEDSIIKINSKLKYAEAHRDTITNRITKYETRYYPVGPTPLLEDPFLADYLARHGKREPLPAYRIDTSR